MKEFVKRLFIAMAMAICILLLFVGAKFTSAQTEHTSYSNLNWLWPADGMLTDTFGARDGLHFGIDIAAEVGTPVYASESGEVVKSYYSHSYGNVIFIQHNNEMETVYAHLHNRLVQEGEKVTKGDKIGEIGNTGRSTGSHLHFEVHNGEWNIHKTTAIDPLLVLEDDEIDSEYSNLADHSELTIQEANTSKYEYIKRDVITVSKGDTLWELSRQYDVTVKELMKWNELDSSLIIIGEELVVHHNGKL